MRVLIVSLVLLVAACRPSSGGLVPLEPTAADLVFVSENKPLDAVSLKQIFLRGSVFQVMVATNKVLATERNQELVGYLMRLWLREPAAVAQMDMEFVNSPSVRVFLANALAQSAASHVLDVDTSQFVETLRAGLDMGDREVVWAAISGLQEFSNDLDVEKIAAIARSGDEATMKVALGALSSSCATHARSRLDEIIAAADERTRSQAREILMVGERVRQTECSN